MRTASLKMLLVLCLVAIALGCVSHRDTWTAAEIHAWTSDRTKWVDPQLDHMP